MLGSSSFFVEEAGMGKSSERQTWWTAILRAM